MDMRDEIIAIGRRSGLAGVGFCDAEPFDDTEMALRQAVRSGRSAGLKFTYADPETSTRVRSTFPWATSLVVGAHGYLADAGHPEEPGGTSARVARFAVADHYAPLRDSLEQVAELLRGQGHRAEVLVDDNRLVDRAAAVRAGVAWWGKSTMALVPGHGPWVLIGSVATDAQLEPSEPMARSCGTCDACLPACPTGALVAPGILDARLCLAYWLQAPGSIPRHLRPALGDRLYGCDDCLDACPPGRPAQLQITKRRGRVDARHVLGMSDAGISDRFHRFYMPWGSPRFMRRNALVVLGNSGDAGALPVLAGYAGHRDSMLREHAIWGIGHLGGPIARRVLQAVAVADPSPRVVEEAETALGEAA